jgi:diguanylate cyclase (GGDEF)-like protein
MSWLCPTPDHRQRFLDMQPKVRLARLSNIVAALIITGVMAPRVGWPLVVTCLVMIAIVLIGSYHLERRERPELWAFYTTVVNIQVLLGVGAAVAGGPRTPLVCMASVPVAIVATRFSARGLIVGAPLGVAVVIAATFGVDPSYVIRRPESMLVPVALVVCIAMYMLPLLDSDLRHRVDSTLDELTGLLNRRSLQSRMAEIAQQAALTGQPVSFVACDLDHFKDINDEYGHATGDIVLREVADAMRGRLRTFELLYRVGGEEFLLVLPGGDEGAAMSIAEALRVAVAEARPAGHPITCSFGVATSRGAEVTLASLWKASDVALYAAKRGGRNRVEVFDARLSAAA